MKNTQKLYGTCDAEGYYGDHTIVYSAHYTMAAAQAEAARANRKYKYAQFQSVYLPGGARIGQRITRHAVQFQYA